MKRLFFGAIVCICVSSCAISRALVHWEANIDDHRFLPSVEIAAAEDPFVFAEGDAESRRALAEYMVDGLPLDRYLAEKTSTVAFLVIRNDSILFENYYRGYDREKISAVFSVSKSVTSLLTGIAVDEGYIESVHDPVTKYVPELAKKDPRFGRLTIEHLLDMRSGFRFNENNHWPASKATGLYYGTNYAGKMRRMKFAHEPGEVKDYQSATTAMLGYVVQRATGRNFADYLQEKVWLPLGMENRATWNIDDRRHNIAKADAGLNATARDLAKIGRLYLDGGNWNGVQIVDQAWVERSATPKLDNFGYQYQWYSMGANLPNREREDKLWPEEQAKNDQKLAEILPGLGFPHWRIAESERHPGFWYIVAHRDKEAFYAFGLYNQMVWVDPAKNIVIVRLGQGSDRGYLSFASSLSQVL